MVPSLKIVTNLLWTCKKLHFKGDVYQFFGQQYSTMHTNRHPLTFPTKKSTALAVFGEYLYRCYVYKISDILLYSFCLFCSIASIIIWSLNKKSYFYPITFVTISISIYNFLLKVAQLFKTKQINTSIRPYQTVFCLPNCCASLGNN